MQHTAIEPVGGNPDWFLETASLLIEIYVITYCQSP
jgi:hypothetical protein